MAKIELEEQDYNLMKSELDELRNAKKGLQEELQVALENSKKIETEKETTEKEFKKLHDRFEFYEDYVKNKHWESSKTNLTNPNEPQSSPKTFKDEINNLDLDGFIEE